MDLDLMRRRLVEAREFNGYNRKQFSQAIGVPYRTVTNYENGSREPGGDYISKVADFCGCTTDWLLGLTNNARENVADAARRAGLDPQMQLLIEACKDLNPAAIRRVTSYAEDLAFNPANKK